VLAVFNRVVCEGFIEEATLERNHLAIWRKNSGRGIISKYKASEVGEYLCVQAHYKEAIVPGEEAESGDVTTDGEERELGINPVKSF